MAIYNAVIIGGGVSGLMAAYKLKLAGKRIAVIERGKDLHYRRRNVPFEVANGVGGAGLFSDGKLSTYPSATQLWRLDETALRNAYSEVKRFLHDFAVEIDPFPDISVQEKPTDIVRLKRYQSLLLSLEQRMGIVYRMSMEIGREAIMTDTEVVRIKKSDSRYEIDVTHGRQKSTLVTEGVILAGGKHCFHHLQPIMNGITVNETFAKTEVGIRIECDNASFDYYSDEQHDIKLISQTKPNREVRTFCCCRDGVVLQSESYGLTGYNGSSGEHAATGNTNIGILVQTTGYEAQRFWKEITRSGRLKGGTASLSAFMKGEHVLLGRLIDEDIRRFLKDTLPIMAESDGRVYFPAIEKMGNYPVISDTLRMGTENVWVCGDATGLFRGLMPAFVSGCIAAESLSRVLRQQENRVLERIHVKVSPTQSRKVVFAAQSKQSFYCRNAVCEYIFNHDCIPVNPFRIFGYFLDERVDRSLVRNGNNEMISRCDELWVFGQISDGVLFEIALCRRLGKPVRYFSISAIAKEIKELRPDELVFEPEVHKHQVKREDLLNLVSMSKGEQGKELQLSLF